MAVWEFVYTALKGRVKAQDPLAVITELISDTESSRYLVMVDMGIADWRIFLELRVSELHGRMICAMALRYSATSILTNDPEIQKKSRAATIW